MGTKLNKSKEPSKLFLDFYMENPGDLLPDFNARLSVLQQCSEISNIDLTGPMLNYAAAKVVESKRSLRSLVDVLLFYYRKRNIRYSSYRDIIYNYLDKERLEHIIMNNLEKEEYQNGTLTFLKTIFGIVPDTEITNEFILNTVDDKKLKLRIGTYKENIIKEFLNSLKFGESGKMAEREAELDVNLYVKDYFYNNSKIEKVCVRSEFIDFFLKIVTLSRDRIDDENFNADTRQIFEAAADLQRYYWASQEIEKCKAKMQGAEFVESTLFVYKRDLLNAYNFLDEVTNDLNHALRGVEPFNNEVLLEGII